MAIVRRKARDEAGDADEQIIEQGDIFFAYRPRVDKGEAEGLEDVQRFFMVLKPQGGFMVLKPQGGAPFRLAVLGRQRLPGADRHERIWGFIEDRQSGNAIERTHSWLNRFCRILIRWEKKPENYLAMLHFALAIITWQNAALPR